MKVELSKSDGKMLARAATEEKLRTAFWHEWIETGQPGFWSFEEYYDNIVEKVIDDYLLNKD